MSELKLYAERKNTGVEWLGEVPQHWSVQPATAISRVLTSTVDKKSYEGEVPVRLCNYTDVYYNDVIADDPEFMKATATAAQIAQFTPRAGDVPITKDSETSNDVGISAYVPQDLPGVVYGYHLAIYRPSDTRFGRFLKYLFDSEYVKVSFENKTPGVTRVGLSQNTMKYLRIPVPPVEEAIKISDYLDHEFSEINAFVADQEKLISLLDERRSATITRAVTQGIDSFAPLSHSGFGWLGEIPSHWTTAPLKRSISFITSGSRDWASFYADEGVPFIRIGNLTRGYLHLNMRDTQHVNINAGSEGARSRLSEDDVLFSITAYLGSVAVVDSTMEGAYISQHVAVVRPLQHKIASRYLGYCALADWGQRQLAEQAYGGTKVQLSLGDIKNFVTPLPPIDEQLRIAEHLDQETHEIDAAIVDAQLAIDLSRERRAALLSAAVTGKIDVRSWEGSAERVLESHGIA